MRHPQRLALAGLLCVALAATSCGTRRPDKDFLAAGAGTDQQGSQPATTGDGGSTGDGGATGVITPGGSTTGTTGTTGSGATETTGAGSGTTGATGTSGSSTTGGVANYASAVGVTATTINIGNVITKSGAFGEDQFTPIYYGAAAFFSDLNAHGGINGRRVIFNICDDGGDNAQGQRACVASSTSRRCSPSSPMSAWHATG